MVSGIKTDWIIYGVAAGVMLMALSGGKDRNRDGEPDGLLNGWGFDFGSGVVGGVVGVFDGALDALAAPFGGSYSDCEKAKASGDVWGKVWACWPTEWGKK